jgi:hypothetical protein
MISAMKMDLTILWFTFELRLLLLLRRFVGALFAITTTAALKALFTTRTGP